MGTDIVVFSEKKNRKTGKWESLDKWIYQKLSMGGGYLYVRDQVYTGGRNYDLFAFFAGIRGDLEPISERKPEPSDLSEKVRDYFDDETCSDYYATWYSYRELREANIGLSYRTIKKGGFVVKKNYDIFKKTNRPPSYFMAGGGPHISNEEMDKLVLSKKEYESDFGPCTYVEWEESYYECVGIEIDQILYELEKRNPNVKYWPEDTRIVIGFD